MGKSTGLGTRGPGAGLEAGARLCLAGQQHLAVLRDLPLQRLHEIRTCGGTTTRPAVRAPGSARAPPGGETGEGTWGGAPEAQRPPGCWDPAAPQEGPGVRRGRPLGADCKEALTLGLGQVLAGGQHWVKRQWPSLGAAAGQRDLLTP